MTRSRWVVLSSLLAFAVAGTAIAAKEAGDDKKKAKAGADKPSGLPPGVTLNACGCYAKGNGCVCTNKKAKCECPGECEPAGCDEKRNKEAEKEYSDAVKKAQDEEKQREAAEKKKVQDEEKKRKDAEAAERKRIDDENAAAAEASPPGDEGEKTDSKPKKPAPKKK